VDFWNVDDTTDPSRRVHTRLLAEEIRASANPVEVILAKTEQGRAILGVVDGGSPLGVETDGDVNVRKELLRKIGYKLNDGRADDGRPQRGRSPEPRWPPDARGAGARPTVTRSGARVAARGRRVFRPAARSPQPQRAASRVSLPNAA
jgi:hypothetical protein